MEEAAPGAPFAVVRLQSTPSTNDAAMAHARAGGAGNTWFVANEQTQGRGRHGRNWASPAGNLYASLLLIDACPLAHAPKLGFVAGVALAHAVRDCLGSDMPAIELKWPNDLVCEGAKLSGLLLEGCRLDDGRSATVIGFGVNCESHPEGLPYRATSLAALGARDAKPRIVHEALSREMARWLAVFARGAGFAAIRAAWLVRAAGVGSTIRVGAGADMLEGRFETIDDGGRLMLATRDGIMPIAAGDVFLLDAPLQVATRQA